MRLKNVILFAIFLGLAGFVASCSKDKGQEKPKEEGQPLPEVYIKNLPADPATRNLNNGDLIGADNRFTFFRFSDSSVILYDSVPSPRADSNSTKWDIAFRGTDIILNSGVNGPGKVEGQVLSNTLEGVTEAPKGGYKQDKSTGDVFSDWYVYDPQNHVITPKAGFILIIHTNDGKYVKMEINGYYKDIPDHPTIKSDQRYYTFHYVIQPDGSRKFTK